MEGILNQLVIFGLTGDLAQRKLLPALYSVIQAGLLPTNTKITGVTRRDVTVDTVLEGVRKHVASLGNPVDEAAFSKLAAMIEMYQMSLTEEADYAGLLEFLQSQGAANRLYYLSIPPQVFLPVVRRLGETGHNVPDPDGGSVRLLVEKPFGYDLGSARELIEAMGEYFAEQQVYRIDHYLAKETAQNLLAFRFGNPLFEAVWDSRSIDHIEIIAAESLGIEGRAVFYEQTGALRDIVQSHLLQLLALVTMERPAAFDSQGIHKAKVEILNKIMPISPDKVADETVRGQYAAYREEADNPDSNTETFAALCLKIDDDRWRGVPMLIRTGKQLASKATEITVIFKPLHDDEQPNILTFYIQPNEGIGLRLAAKRPGFENLMIPVDMGFRYDTSFSERQPDAYERVLLDAFKGDRTLFASGDEVLRSWAIIENVIREWSKNDEGLYVYEPGSWGPVEADKLAKNAKVSWHNPAV